MTIPFTLVHAGAWGWRERISSEAVEAIETAFPAAKKTQTQLPAWPSVSEVTCHACGSQYYFFAEVDEYRNSVFRLFARGIALRVT